jgi:hypothetical protein
MGDQDNASPHPIKGEGVIEVHAPALPGHWGRWLLYFYPFHMKSAST